MENYSKELEDSILGYLLTNPKSLSESLIFLKRDYFYFEINRIIFNAIFEVFKKENPVDLLTVSDYLEEKNKLDYIGGASHLTGMISHTTISYDPKHYYLLLKNKYEIRKTYELLKVYENKIEKNEYKGIKELLGSLSEDTFKISNSSINENTSVKDAIQEFSNKQDLYDEKLASGEQYLGISTGIKSLDKLIEGMQPEHLITISAFTSTGKSTFSMNIVKNLLDRNYRVCIFSLEMSKVDIVGKLLALETCLPTARLIKEVRDNNVYEKQKDAKFKLSTKKLTIYSEISNVEDIALAMQSEMTKEKVDLFIIDYIQNITGAANANEYQLMTYSIKLLQQVNRNLKSTLMLLSQVSNETIKSTETFNVQGKNSGSIRHASDVFVYLKRDASEEELTEIYNSGVDVPLKCIVNKNRHGRIGTFKLNLKQTTGEMFEPI